MKRNTRQIHLRVTEDEAKEIIDKARSYPSINEFVKRAIASYNNFDANRRIELLRALGEYYIRFRDELSWTGSNLNQVVKRANELAKANLLPPAYVTEVIMPAVNAIQETINKMKEELLSVSRKVRKL